jgi:hypothetical protein
MELATITITAENSAALLACQKLIGVSRIGVERSLEPFGRPSSGLTSRHVQPPQPLPRPHHGRLRMAQPGLRGWTVDEPRAVELAARRTTRDGWQQ